MGDIASAIKESVCMEDVLRHYGLPTARNGRIPCPLHNGKDRNFSYKNGYFKCFVCGRGGSVIDFVMELYGISFAQAVVHLNADLGLGLTGERPSPAARSKALEERRRAAARAAQLEEEYRVLAREHLYWHEAEVLFAPSREAWEADAVHPLYLEAVKRLPGLEWECETLSRRCTEDRG